MHSETVTVVIPAPRASVFNYMADPANMPEWAREFCHEVKEENGIYKAVTPMGEMIVRIKAYEETGVIDLYASADGKRDVPLATRVLPLPDGQTVCTTIFFQEPGVSDEIYQQQLGSFRREMDNVKSLFTQK